MPKWSDAPPVTTPTPTPKWAEAPVSASEAQQQLDITPYLEAGIKGFVNTTIPSMASLDQMGEAAVAGPSPIDLYVGDDGKVHVRPSKPTQLGLDMLTGLARAHGEQFKKAGEKVREMVSPETRNIDRLGMGVQALGHTAAGLTPGVGPAAADAGEKIGSGEGMKAAEGVGEAAGMLAPLVLLSKKIPEATVTAKANALEKAATEKFAKAIGTRPQDVPDVMKGAPTFIRKLRPGNTEEMLAQVKGEGSLTTKGGSAVDPNSLLGKAEKELEAVKAANADVPVDVMPAADYVRDIPKLESPPGTKGPVSIDPNQSLVRATEAWAKKIEEKAQVHGTPGVPEQPPTPPSRDPFTGKEIPGDPGFPEQPPAPGPVPASEVFKMRTQAGDVANPAFGKLGKPLVELTAENKAALRADMGISNVLHDAIPTLKDADLTYHQTRQLSDLLQNVAQRNVANKNASALQVLATRNLIKGAAGSLLGGAAGAGGAVALGAGGLPAAAMGMMGASAYGVFKVAQDIVNSPYWLSLSAKARLAVADYIRSGGLNTNRVAQESLAVATPAAGRYADEGNNR